MDFLTQLSSGTLDWVRLYFVCVCWSCMVSLSLIRMVFALVYCIVIVMHSVILAACMIGLLTGSLDGYFQGFPMDLGQTRGRYRLVWDVILLDAWPKSYAAESGNPTVWDYSSMFTTTCCPSRCCVEFDSRIRPAMRLYYGIITRALYGWTIESWTVNPAIDQLTVLIL